MTTKKRTFKWYHLSFLTYSRSFLVLRPHSPLHPLHHLNHLCLPPLARSASLGPVALRRRRRVMNAAKRRTFQWYHLCFFMSSPLISCPQAPRSAPPAPSLSGATGKERQPGASGPPAAPATERPPHEAIHLRLIAEYKKKHSKDPSSNLWYRFLDQAHAEVATAQEGKRARRARFMPGFLNSDNIA